MNPKKGERLLTVEYLNPRDLKPSRHNTRTHSPGQIDEIAQSILKTGWTKPIIVDENKEILAGHGAHKAALQIGVSSVPVIIRDDLNEGQKRAYRIADNKLAEKSMWDLDTLKLEFGDLRGMGFDMSLTGFSPGEISDLIDIKDKREKEPPLIPVQDRAITVLGDVWQMGAHRLICGDSTKPETYDALMDGRKAQCVFTDPPYGVSYQGSTNAFDVIAGDDKRRGELKDILRSAFKLAAKHARPDAGWYVWHASSTREDFAQAMRDAGIVELSYLIWEKPGGVMGWSDYRPAHEPCFYACKQGEKPYFQGDRTNTTAWKIEHMGEGQATTIDGGLLIVGPDGREICLTDQPPKGKKLRHLYLEDGEALVQPSSDMDDLWKISRDNGGKNMIHPTMKPVDLSRKACLNSAREGDVVLDVFSGSGSTIMGCERTGRVGYAIELDPRYVDATVRRWETITKQEAIHATEGISFARIGKEREA